MSRDRDVFIGTIPKFISWFQFTSVCIFIGFFSTVNFSFVQYWLSMILAAFQYNIGSSFRFVTNYRVTDKRPSFYIHWCISIREFVTKLPLVVFGYNYKLSIARWIFKEKAKNLLILMNLTAYTTARRNLIVMTLNMSQRKIIR